MFKRFRIFLFVLPLFTLFLNGCKSKETIDAVSPTLVSSIPLAGATSVEINTPITLQFSEIITLASVPNIKLNGELVTATVNSKTLTIVATLKSSTSYTLIIPNTAVKNTAGNFVNEITLSFTTTQSVLTDITVYEAEKATLTTDAAVATSLTGYTGTGFVNTNGGNVTFNIQAVQTGYYDVSLRYSTSNQKKANDLYVDGNNVVSLDFGAVSVRTTLAAGRIKLSAGAHTIAIVKNWGWIQLDNITLSYYGTTLDPFNIVANLVTLNPTPEAVKLYNFLKASFGTKVISGTTSNSNNSNDEAIWVNQQTGKWPALVCFDFINHPWLNQNWVDYDAPFRNGKDYWNNNGIVNLMWHWRDPLSANKSGDFYTEKTTFDVSKISDTNSAEYKAMIADIDVISSYIKQFKDANIPVIWRPLHEASGGWFWWGAKGAGPCKALWKLMYDRMVKVNGLNNMIWVWTTDVSGEAMNWYPGDEYVDIVGMDIYPGENQHGSQYFSYNKVKDLFGGKKLITLSECGSVPDPALMKENGDMWSWFMPWNGDYTRADIHNGATWWKKFFGYDFVLTRDKMPGLKN
jgi:mannan endo-1,4-beta-mannosidase